MTYLELYEDALRKLHNNLITLGEFEMMVKPLNREVEAEPKAGKWKTDMVYAGIEFYRCDQCDFRQSEKSRYCPNCGSRMCREDGEEE